MTTVYVCEHSQVVRAVRRYRRCKNVPPAYRMTASGAHTMADTGLHDCMTISDLCEVGESESDNNGRNGALTSADNVAHVHGNLAVGWLGCDEGTIGASGRISGKINKLALQYGRLVSRTYPDPDGKAETLDGRLVAVASMSVLVAVPLCLLETGGKCYRHWSLMAALGKHSQSSLMSRLAKYWTQRFLKMSPMGTESRCSKKPTQKRQTNPRQMVRLVEPTKMSQQA
ncbi:hypothetical protein CC86DRAFT_208867 [Ophiobolus disseminans]|uniref:Uncharacterized protein n=1 Tax=Ophiobolus disseminans TaxID=1469910 RepID=A0A6A7A3D8_9PLEO|nr:hypothetical protein CC86DRAFT_208867 [Ophiobolus disseminans]